MEIFDENKAVLKDIWEDNVLRQQAKLVIAEALANATSLTIKEGRDVTEELDRLLLGEEEESKTQKNPGL